MSQNLPQIYTASAYANIKHALKQMLYRFAIISETLSNTIPKKENIAYRLSKKSCSIFLVDSPYKNAQEEIVEEKTGHQNNLIIIAIELKSKY